MTDVVTPTPLLPFEPEFKPAAWHAYSLGELGWWVHLLAMRAEHRVPGEKRDKDLQDAQNYLHMMQAKLTAIRNTVP